MMRIIPLTVRQANGLIGQWHRHHKPARGHRFSLGCELDGELVGAAIVGRPVARGCDAATVCEVTRLVTNGAKNACSFLYGATARVAKEMGFRLIQTYILDSEPGTSLKAAGWRFDGLVRGRQWDHSSERQLRLGGGTRRNDQPTDDKQRWVRALR